MSNYHPPTKLREGNVFTGMCLLTRGEVCMPGLRSLLKGGYVWSQLPCGGGGGGGVGILVPGPFRGGYVSWYDKNQLKFIGKTNRLKEMFIFTIWPISCIPLAFLIGI